MDVNGDDFLDVILCNGGGLGTDSLIVTPPLWFPAGQSISVLQGNGRGGFAQPIQYPTARRPVHFIARDFDRDEDIDLAIACRDDSVISVLRGAGNGGFEPAQSIWVPGAPTWLDVGDIDMDGQVDLAVTLERKSVAFLRGSSDGSFVLAGEVAQNRTAAAALGDLDLDGKLDLVIATGFGGQIVWRWGHGDGTFGPEGSSMGLGGNLKTIELADFDGDGLLDALTLNQGVNAFVLLSRGTPNGWLFPAHNFETDAALATRITDVDRDGNLDILVGDVLGHTSRLFFGLGNGSFDTGVVLEHTGTYVDAADIDGDGCRDLLGVRTWHPRDPTGALHVRRGLGERRFGGLDGSFGTAEGPVDLVASDINADGNLDVVVAGFRGEVVTVHLGDGVGRFGHGIDTRPAGWGPTSIGVARLDEDAFPDLVIANQWSTNLSIHAGRGDGTFVTANTLIATAKNLQLADLNADGLLDIFSGDSFVHLGQGDFAFRDISQPLDTHIVLSRMAQSQLGDMSSDGILDIVGIIPEDDRAVVLFGAGDGLFSLGPSFGVATGAICCDLGDVDEDGRIDLGVCSRSSSQAVLEIWRGNGDGTFTHGEAASLDHSPNRLRFVDVDADSHQDAVVSDGAFAISVLAGRGDGTFEPRTDYGHTSSNRARSTQFAIADWNADRIPDLAVVQDGENSTASVFPGKLSAPTAVVASLDVLEDAGVPVVVLVIGESTVADLAMVRFERSDARDGPYTTVCSAEPSARIEFRDEGAPSGDIWYRAGLRSATGADFFVGPILRAAVTFVTALTVGVDRGQGSPITIDYTLRLPSRVDLLIYDVRGRVVSRLDRGQRAAGRHQVEWNRRDERGGRAARGIYFVVLRAAGESLVGRVLLQHS